MQIGEESEPVELPIPEHPDRRPIVVPAQPAEPVTPEKVPA